MSKQSDIVKVSQDAGTTGFVNITGDTMTGGLFTPYQVIKGDIPYVGATIRNTRTDTSFSFIDAQNRTTAADSHLFFQHNTDGSSLISFGTQPAGDFTDRRVGGRMIIDGNGRVTKPYQPAFHAHDGQTVQSGDAIVTYTTLLFNDGGHYNSGNGRFTAPVAGTYMFTCYIQPQATTYNTYSSITFRKNGSVYGTSELVLLWSGGADHRIVGGTTLMKMSAGDFCDVQATRGYRGIQGHFCGYLLG